MRWVSIGGKHKRQTVKDPVEWYQEQGLPAKELNMDIRLADVEYHVATAGPGLRAEVFFQGCYRRCPGCTNFHITNWTGGRTFQIAEVLAMLDPVINPGYYQAEMAVTLGGGEPFDQPHSLLALTTCLAKLDRAGKHILLYSGYTYDELWEGQIHLFNDSKITRAVLRNVNVLVDGPWIRERALLGTNTSFIGSDNQRYLILRKGKIAENISAEQANSVPGDVRKQFLWDLNLNIGNE